MAGVADHCVWVWQTLLGAPNRQGETGWGLHNFMAGLGVSRAELTFVLTV